MNDKQKAEAVLRAGQIMLENGAETTRVENTMIYMLKNMGIENGEVFVTTTGIFISVNDATAIKRVTKRSINLNKVSKMNTLSRNLENGILLEQDVNSAIEKISAMKNFPNIFKIIACGVCCFCYTYMLSRLFSDCLASFITGCILYSATLYAEKKNLPSFHISLLGGVIVALCAEIFCGIGIGHNSGDIIIASVMPLVPGVEITNAVRDIVEGNYLSGGSRFFSAIVTGSAIAIGVAFVLKISADLF